MRTDHPVVWVANRFYLSQLLSVSINVTLLRSFHAVAHKGSFTAAAEALHVTQPTLTSQVQALERAYGLELFLRRRPPLVLSPVGHALFEVTQRLFLAQREAEALVSQGRELLTGELRVGSVSSLHVADIVAAFHRRYPGLFVSASITNSNRLAEQLLAHRLDVAILSQEQSEPRFISTPYRSHPLVAFCHRNHPLAGRESLRIKDLEGAAMVLREQGSRTRRILEEVLLECGVRTRVVMEVQGREALRAMVLRGIGLGVISIGVYEPHPDLRVLRLENADLVMRTFLVFMRERRRSPTIRAFLDIVAELKDTASHPGVLPPTIDT